MKMFSKSLLVNSISMAALTICCQATAADASSYSYPVVDTNQNLCYDGTTVLDECPSEGEAFYGQDAQYYSDIQPSYTDNGDSTITDNNTGLIWAQDQSSETLSWQDAFRYCEDLTTADIDDWRIPSVKELWSIRDFSTGWPWIDTDYFNLSSDGTEMSQHHSWTSQAYLVESDYQNDQVIGDPYWIVNDWTGHIKAMSGNRYVRCVSGSDYGANDFVDNGDGTVTDNATGLMWSQDDNGEMLYWEDALAYAEASELAGYDDWRLPNIKELQSISDNDVEEIPALDTSVFNLTEVTNIVYEDDEVIAAQTNYPFYWSSTSNSIVSDDEDVDGGTIYAWFYASGYNVDNLGYDLHGAGSICFGSKTEENAGDENSVEFMVRLVRDTEVTTSDSNTTEETDTTDSEGTDTETIEANNDLCSFEYAIVNDWDTGYIGSVTVSNNTDADISLWEATLNFSDDTEIVSSWNVTLTGSAPTYTATNTSWNGTISAGESISWGIQTSFTDSYELPTITGICE
jgi:hypothetical protein